MLSYDAIFTAMKRAHDVRLRVAFYMERRGWNQSELARLSGVAQPSIWKILEGETARVSFTTLSKIAAVFGVHPGDLLEWDGEPKKPGKKYETF
jgi:transcriptional regulator with XRE-family HTH domain